MQALRFYEPGHVAVVEAPEPTAKPGEVVLKTHATGLCNSDVRVYLGENFNLEWQSGRWQVPETEGSSFKD